MPNPQGFAKSYGGKAGTEVPAHAHALKQAQLCLLSSCWLLVSVETG